jgi:peptide chain release factor 2
MTERRRLAIAMLFVRVLLERRVSVWAWTTVTTSATRTRSSTRQRITSKLFLSSTTRNTYSSGEAFAEAKRQFEQGRELYERNVVATPPNLDLILSDLETEASNPSFWDADQKERNGQVTSQISYYSRIKNRVQEWVQHKGDCEAAMEMLADGDDDLFSPEERQTLLEELQTASAALLEDGERFQLELLLSGPYDKAPCRILLTAGAGGTEANDWVADLKRMYERHAHKMGYSIVVEDEQPGEIVGYKSVELMVSGGQHAYGWFKGEKGAHRLVRLSPFNANNKRQTTFAGVDVAPILMEEDLSDIVIPDKDLEITTMRAGGAGGQNVNKVNSAVRIKHLPSGLNIKCTQGKHTHFYVHTCLYLLTLYYIIDHTTWPFCLLFSLRAESSNQQRRCNEAPEGSALGNCQGAACQRNSRNSGRSSRSLVGSANSKLCPSSVQNGQGSTKRLGDGQCTSLFGWRFGRLHWVPATASSRRRTRSSSTRAERSIIVKLRANINLVDCLVVTF